MATTDLHLQQPGSLQRPGPTGRAVRLLFGLLCLTYVVSLLRVSDNLLESGGHVRPIVWNGIVAGLILVSYVVNIGFSRSWKKWPAFVSAGVFLAIAGFGYVTDGSMEKALLARVIWGWELYLFTHLGATFMVAAMLATPGCEMRAFHDLYARITGVATQEHHCPIGPLSTIDQWESRRAQN